MVPLLVDVFGPEAEPDVFESAVDAETTSSCTRNRSWTAEPWATGVGARVYRSPKKVTARILAGRYMKSAPRCRDIYNRPDTMTAAAGLSRQLSHGA
jgi:hypothetical protein